MKNTSLEEEGKRADHFGNVCPWSDRFLFIQDAKALGNIFKEV